MCYVGQSVDYKTRFRKHKEEAARNNYKYKSLLYNAMNKYGIENFYVELLESQVENYNEREIYWINKLNTIRPHGYNLARGGDWYPNLSGVLHHEAKITSSEDLASIYHDLLYTEKSLTEIGRDFGVSYGVISGINSGKAYRLDGYEYPLREFVLSKGKLDRLTYDLKYSNYGYKELAKIYGISEVQVKSINYGVSQKRDYIEYPIRKMCFSSRRDIDTVVKIQRDLLSTRKSFDDIAKEYGCNSSTVRRINSGKTLKNESYKYPLRNPDVRLSQKDINEIHIALLNTNESVKSISARYNVSDPTIKRINNGATEKYRDEKYNYPLRKM